MDNSKQEVGHNGGPAFPVNDASSAHDIGAAAVMGVEDPAQRDQAYAVARARAVQGMTLRDYFAAQALPGVVGAIMPQECHRWRPEDFAHEAYALADAMLAERNKA